MELEPQPLNTIQFTTTQPRIILVTGTSTKIAEGSDTLASFAPSVKSSRQSDQLFITKHRSYAVPTAPIFTPHIPKVAPKRVLPEYIQDIPYYSTIALYFHNFIPHRQCLHAETAILSCDVIDLRHYETLRGEIQTGIAPCARVGFNSVVVKNYL